MAQGLKDAGESKRLYEKAKKLIPAGVNSPVRNYRPYPLFVSSARGARFTTVDGNEYLDYCMGYGTLLDGHAQRNVTLAVKAAIDSGTVYGQPTRMEVQLAQLITELVPSIETVRLANSGAEATMHAIRLARGFTGRKKVLMFEGGYHGSHDSLLVKRGRPGLPIATASSAGVPDDVARNTLIARYNDENTTAKICQHYSDELAAVIIEPVIGNIGPITPKEGFLKALRESTKDNDIILIFDEVITGFRLALGGAQEYYKIRPDLTVLGKILGGGLPLSAFGGSRKIMEQLAPLGPVYQAGTFNGNPVSVAAGTAMLESLKKRGRQPFTNLEKRGDRLRKSLGEIVERKNVQAQVNGIGSMFQIFFTKRAVTDFDSAKSSDVHSYHRYFQSLLKAGIFVPPSQFETCFLSTVHTEADIGTMINAVDSAMETMAG